MDQELIDAAETLLTRCRDAGIKLVCAESCTGGLISAYLTEVPGSSDVLDRGFVTYSNEAKFELLGVPVDLIAAHGAASAAVALAMAEGALTHSHAGLALAVTGVAGPGGGTADKPVGLVYIAAVGPRGIFHERCEFGGRGRGEIRRLTVARALSLGASLV